MDRKPRPTGPNRHMIVPLREPQPYLYRGVEVRDSAHLRELVAAHQEAETAGYEFRRRLAAAAEADRRTRLHAWLASGRTLFEWYTVAHA